MPRARKTEPAPALQPSVAELLDQPVDQLLAENFRIEDWIAAETKRFNEHLKPHKDRIDAIKQQLHAKLVALGTGDKASIGTDNGTAYLSTIMNLSVTADESPPYVRRDDSSGAEIVSQGREALIDFCMDNWDQIGNEMLMVSAQKDAVRRYIEEHDGNPPPGIKIGYFTRVNVRRS